MAQSDKIKVSILCTAYNHEQYIASALESFVTQKTDFAFEVLVNDDCSTDGTAGVIREYEAKYPDIIRGFYQEKNLYSQHIEIEDAVFYPNIRGEYVAYCEGDDCWIDENKLAIQVGWLDAHPEYSACVCNTIVHDCSGAEPDRPFIATSEDRDVSFKTVLSGMSNSFHTSTFLVRTPFITNPPDFQRVAEKYRFTDWPQALWFTMQGKVRFIDRQMSLYRTASNPSSWSSGIGMKYVNLRQFVDGEVHILETLMHHLSGADLEAAQKRLEECRFELMYITGDAKGMLQGPYRKLLREKPFSYRLKTYLKAYLPGLHALYRNSRGYTEQ